jgi:opacity protein-like surface antigen
MTFFSQKSKILVSSVILASAISTNALAEDMKGFYIAAEYGATRPMSKSFKIDDFKVEARGGKTYGARVGYQFHSDMFVDFSYANRPYIKMSSSLDKGLPPGVTLAWGSTKMKLESYILSVIYNMPNGTRYTPYVGLGAGIAKITVRKGDASVSIPVTGVPAQPSFSGVSGRVLKSSKLVPSVRLTLGANAAITDSLSLYADMKAEVTKKVKVGIEIDNPLTAQLEDTKRPKTSLGMVEASIGVKYSF